MKISAFFSSLLVVLSASSWADTVRLVGSEAVEDYLLKHASGIKSATGHTLSIETGGSVEGYNAANKSLLGMVSRPPLPSEQAGNLTLIEVGIEALVIGVNFSNRVESLTIKQISDIFNGHINSWKSVMPGFNHRVSIYGPEINHGAYDFFSNAFHLDEADLAKRATLSSTHRKTLRYIATHEGNIGFFTYGAWIQQELSYASYVNLVAINGVKPSHATVASGEYPLVQPLYFVTNRKLTRAEQDVVDYLVSL